jgi:hypothetical protein
MAVIPATIARIVDRTAADWLSILSARLDAQALHVSVFEAYYDGDHPLQFATSKFKEAFGNLFSAFADNWCPIVVDAPVERLQVVGFRMKSATSADNDAWDIWQANALDVESVIAHTEAGKCGKAYLLVDPNNGDPRITVEHASQVVVAHDPGDRRRRVAALKRWHGDDGYLYATLYLPDFVLKFESELATAIPYGTPVEWHTRSGDSGGPNPLGIVPIIPLENTPTLLGGGQSDLKPAIPIQNAINKLCTDMLVASEFGAFRQRVLTGVEIPRDPETGRPLGRSEIVAAMSRLWTFESSDAKVYDLTALPTRASRERVGRRAEGGRSRVGVEVPAEDSRVLGPVGRSHVACLGVRRSHGRAGRRGIAMGRPRTDFASRASGRGDQEAVAIHPAGSHLAGTRLHAGANRRHEATSRPTRARATTRARAGHARRAGHAGDDATRSTRNT